MAIHPTINIGEMDDDQIVQALVSAVQAIAEKG